LSGFVRVVTNRRVFAEPTSVRDAWQAVDTLLAAPAAMKLSTGQRHWELFRMLADDIDARAREQRDLAECRPGVRSFQTATLGSSAGRLSIPSTQDALIRVGKPHWVTSHSAIGMTQLRR